jgi:hypothetical protein
MVVATLALIVGIAIGYVDSRATWDDTGVTAGALLLSSAVLAFARPRIAWLVALAVGAPVVVFNVVLRGGFGSAIAIGVSLIGAVIGAGIGKAIGADPSTRSA